MSNVFVVELASEQLLQNLWHPDTPRRVTVQVPGLANLLTVHISRLQGSLLAFFQGAPYPESLPHLFYLSYNDEALPPDCIPELHCFSGPLGPLPDFGAPDSFGQENWVHVYALSRRVV